MPKSNLYDLQESIWSEVVSTDNDYKHEGYTPSMLKSFVRPENIPANVVLIQAIYKVNTKAFSPIGEES